MLRDVIPKKGKTINLKEKQNLIPLLQKVLEQPPM